MSTSSVKELDVDKVPVIDIGSLRDPMSIMGTLSMSSSFTIEVLI